MIIYLDVDGVLSDFVSSMVPALGGSLQELLKRWPPGLWEYYRLLGDPVCVRNAVDKLGEEFWANIAPYPKAGLLYTFCKSVAPTFFCTKPTNDPGCLAGKLSWFYNFTGDYKFNNYVMTAHKHLLARPDCLLIDDSDANAEAFREAGGSSIVVPQHWNSRHSEAANGYDLVLDEILKWKHEMELKHGFEVNSPLAASSADQALMPSMFSLPAIAMQNPMLN